MNADPPRRPAVPICIALVAGAVLGGSTGAVSQAIVAGYGGLALLVIVLARRRFRSVLAICACTALLVGMGLRIHGDRAADARVTARLGHPGDTVETSFVGELLTAPELNSEGEWVLFLRGRPEGEKGSLPPLSVRLIVSKPSGEAGDLLADLCAGDLLRAWSRLRRPRGFTNPGSSEPEIWMRARGLDALGRVKSAWLVERLKQGAPGFRRSVCLAKEWARSRLPPGPDEEGGTRVLLAAMLLGDRAALRPDAVRRLRDAGLVHLVAISGLHVGILAAVMLGLLRRLGLSPPLLLAVSLISLPLFASLVGGRPPVSRAALGVGIALAGRAIGRETDWIHLLWLIAATLVAGRPAVVGDAGFQLTFIATAGILKGAPYLSRRLPLPRPLASGFAVTTAAYLATAPLVAFHFGRVAPVALLSNLAAAPLCAGLLVAGYAGILLHDVPFGGEWMAWCGNVLAGALVGLADSGAGVAGGAWRVPPPSTFCMLLYYGTALSFFLPTREGGRGHLVRLLRSAFALLVVWIHVGPAPPGDGRFRASLLDLGQGQCVVLRSPRGQTILVDAGGSASPRFDPGERVVLPYLDASAVRRVEVLAVTHGDLDHAGGAFAVLREKEVGELWLPPGYHLHPRLGALAREAIGRGTALVLAERGRGFWRGGLPIRVLAPGRSSGVLSTNDRSLVLLAGRRPARILVTGDLEWKGERNLLGTGQDLAAEILVVGHHGARNGTSAPFLERVRPRHAVVSCGFRNRFGHPSAETLDRIGAAGARSWRTDVDGMLAMTTETGGWTVTPRRR